MDACFVLVRGRKTQVCAVQLDVVLHLTPPPTSPPTLTTRKKSTHLTFSKMIFVPGFRVNFCQPGEFAWLSR